MPSLATGSLTVCAPVTGASELAEVASSRWNLAGWRDSRVCHADGPVLIVGPAYSAASADAGSADGFDRFLASGSQIDLEADSSD